MPEHTRVDEFLTSLLSICKPLEPFEMSLLDAHGATLAEDIYAGERMVLRSGTRIRSTQIGLAASIGRDHLPTRPHPRVVVLSAGPDLVEPGQQLKNSSDEYETNSWLLTTAVREVGAVAYRVHSIPETEEELQKVIEDQLVRADLIIISGERHDDSFDLITRTLSSLGTITTVDMAIEASGRHSYGVIGPDKTPVVTLPGDPIAAYISFELFVRPMIRTMLGASTIHRPSVKASLEKPIESTKGLRSYIRAVLAEDGKSVTPLESQDEQSTLSDANAFIAISEVDTSFKTGDRVNGQISWGGVIYGAMRGGHIGYWIDRNFANRGYTTMAVQMLTEYAFKELNLHRIEINLRPENAASRKVAEKAGYILEGQRPRYLHIDGDWRDHIVFVKENPGL